MLLSLASQPNYILTDCAQPTNDGQAAGWAFKDKVGYGKPSENPCVEDIHLAVSSSTNTKCPVTRLFLNIGIPAGFDPTSAQTQYPVKIYIHGGFLQFGSPHTVSSQPQYVCAEQNVVWVSVGYRVSVLGFLACDEPKIDGNYGFKDQWQALLWIEKNIARFGGMWQLVSFDQTERAYAVHFSQAILITSSSLGSLLVSCYRIHGLDDANIDIRRTFRSPDLAPRLSASTRPEFSLPIR